MSKNLQSASIRVMIAQKTSTVTSLSIVEGSEWPHLRQALDPVIHDTRLRKVVIVSTDKEHAEDIKLYAKMYLEKVVLVEESAEAGRAHLFSQAIQKAKEQQTDYALFLEHDAIPEEDFISRLLDNYKYFKEKDSKHLILIANTVDIFGNEKSFYGSATKKDFKDGTVFDLLSLQKLSKILHHLFRIGAHMTLPPIFRTQAYIGGGTFIPKNALVSAVPPNATLYKYGEDTDYAWKLKKAGYSFYQCASPVLRKPSSDKKQHHVFDLFSSSTPDKDAYYHIRNAILISRKHTYQSRPVLFINILLWVSAACLVGLRRSSSFTLYAKRLGIILKAVVHGYTEKHYGHTSHK